MPLSYNTSMKLHATCIVRSKLIYIIGKTWIKSNSVCQHKETFQTKRLTYKQRKTRHAEKVVLFFSKFAVRFSYVDIFFCIPCCVRKIKSKFYRIFNVFIVKLINIDDNGNILLK